MKKAGLFLLLLLWGFSGLSQESQAGFCSECVGGNKIVRDLEFFKKMTCEEVIKTPECQRVPEEDLRDCGISGLLTVPFWGLGTVATAATSIVAITSGAAFFGLLYASVPLFAGYKMNESLQYLSRELYASQEFARIYQNIPGPDREQKTASVMLCKTGEQVYNSFYNDYACLNDRVRSIRACGSAAALVGLTKKGVRMDLSDRAREQDMLAFYKVRQEVMKKFKLKKAAQDSGKVLPTSSFPN